MVPLSLIKELKLKTLKSLNGEIGLKSTKILWSLN